MKRFFVMLAVVLAFCPSGTEAGEPATIEGTWRVVTSELGGQKLPEATFAATRLDLGPTTYKLTTPDGVDQGVLKIARGKPMTMDITGTEGPNKGKTILAIFELAGDRLTVCYDLGGEGRPTELSTARGSQRFLVTYRREKAGAHRN